MKTPLLHPARKVLLFTLLAVPWLHGESLDSRKNEIVETKLSQKDLQSSTIRLSQDIANLLAELRSNQLDEKQVATAESTLAQLMGVSETEMAAVLQNLALADDAEEMSQFQSHVVGAIKEQNKAADRLQRLANALTARQSLEGLAQRIQSIIQRQTRNIQQTEGVMNGGKSRKQQERTETLLASTKLQQAGLADDIQSLAATFAQIQTGTEDARASTAAALFKDRGIAAISIAARDQLEAGDLPSSLLGQRDILGILSALFAAVQDPVSRTAAIENLKRESARLADAENQLAIESAEGRQGRREPLKESQRIIAAKTEALRAQLAALDPASAKLVAEAAQKMAESLDELSARKTDFSTAAENQTAAAELLAKAAETLESTVAQDSTPLSPAAAFEALKKLDQDVAAAQAAQAAVESAKTGSAPSPAQEQAQQNVAEAVSAAQIAAAPLSPAAAQSLGEAQQQMMDPASSAQAVPALANARSEIQKEMEGLEAAAAEEKELAALAAGIEKAAELARTAESLAAAPPSGDPNADAKSAMAFADAKNAALEAQKAAQEAAPAAEAPPTASASPAPSPGAAPAPGEAPASSPGAEAGAALAEAAKALTEAMKQAAAGDAAAASAAGKEAQAQLAQAMSAVAPPGAPGAPGAPAPGEPGAAPGTEAQASAAAPPGGSPGAAAPGSAAPAPGAGDAPAPPTSPSESLAGGGGQSTSLVGGDAAPGPKEAAELVDLSTVNGSAVIYATVSTSENTGSVIASRLRPAERESLQSLQKEKAPKGYASEVEQYYRNLAENQ